MFVSSLCILGHFSIAVLLRSSSRDFNHSVTLLVTLLVIGGLITFVVLEKQILFALSPAARWLREWVKSPPGLVRKSNMSDQNARCLAHTHRHYGCHVIPPSMSLSSMVRMQ